MNFWKMVKSREFAIIITVILILTIGLVALSSASQGPENNYSDLKKQLISVFIGIIALVMVATIDYEIYVRYWYVFYVPCIILLIAVLFTDPINNARSWFVIDEINFAIQPSEFSKIIIILTVARFLSDLKSRSMSYREKTKKIITLVVLVMIPVLLIVKQPDFGTAMVFVASIAAMVFVWGIDVKYIKFSILALVALVPTVYFFFLSNVQKERIKVFLDPTRDPSGGGYHVIQSKLAIGAGQLGGMGLFNGTQTQMGYLFAKTTDFIFAAIAEELGFIIAAILIVLLIILVINCFNIANIARDEEGRLIAAGVGMMFGFHIIVNVGMTMGLVPVTGIPLPFVSYGGSSMLTNMIAIGLILSVSLRKTGLRF